MIPADLFDSALRGFLEPILPFLDDESVTEVMVNGPSDVFIERKGKLSKTEATFGSAEKLLSGLRVVAQYVGRPLDEQHPILEARLPDGSRVQALLPPVSPDGPSVAIRRFSKEKLTLGRLLALGALTLDAAETLRVLVECKQNIVVAGGTGSGKTSMLNALSALVPEGERIVVIEDARELQLQREHVVQLEARPADARGKGAVTIRDLFKATLRMRPDRIVLGEIRGGEALDLVQAMTSGHGGCLTTVHATYPIDTMNRLETMALMGGVELPLVALRTQLASAVDIIVQVSRFRDGRRGVTHITEVCGVDPTHGYRLKDLFAAIPQHRGDGTVALDLEPTGVIPDCYPLLQSHGLDLPPVVHEAHRKARGIQ
ncbi:MAG TPA: CpaF family protein [Polyangiaceae bacterium]|jgi:pilus assembly protein CpaF|nr:CpaF family protein [Polyangiaceae bacterium]